jgi:hypothetical protein
MEGVAADAEGDEETEEPVERSGEGPDDAEIEGISEEGATEDGWLDRGVSEVSSGREGGPELEGKSEDDEPGEAELSSPGVGPVPWGF